MAAKAKVLVLTGADLEQFETEKAKDKAAARKQYLAKGYIPCVIAGCDGLVAPRFIRTITRDGQELHYGYCPRREAHDRIRNAQ